MEGRGEEVKFSKWEARHIERKRKVIELEEKAEKIHELLVEVWKRGEHSKDLLAQDREIHANLKEARVEYEIGLKAKP